MCLIYRRRNLPAGDIAAAGTTRLDDKRRGTHQWTDNVRGKWGPVWGKTDVGNGSRMPENAAHQPTESVAGHAEEGKGRVIVAGRSQGRGDEKGERIYLIYRRRNSPAGGIAAAGTTRLGDKRGGTHRWTDNVRGK